MKRNKISGNQITNNYNKTFEELKNKNTGHRNKAEIAERQSRLQLLEKLVKEESSNHMGMTTSYRPEYAKQVYYLSLLGATIAIIAMYFNVTPDTINKWGRANPSFADSIKRGGVDFDMQVAERMGQLALGYDYTESEEWDVYNKKTGEVVRMHKIYHKHRQPDVTAQIFWLKNRQRGIWTDVSRTELYTQTDINIKKQIDLSVLSNVESESIKQIAIAMLSKDKGSIELDKK